MKALGTKTLVMMGLLGLVAVIGFVDWTVMGMMASQSPGLMLGIGAVIGVVFLMLSGGSKKSDSALAAALSKLSQENFSVSLDAKQDKVAPEVAASFNQLVSALGARQSSTEMFASGLAAVDQPIQAAMANVAQCSGGDTAHEVTTAIDELGAAVEEIANNAASAAESTHQAMKETDNGKVTMTDAMGSMSSLTDHIARASDAVARLGQESQNIGAVLDVIRGIAEQTNLLALNAAIEAARAGEQGRGFAVVADEVRTLASRTQQSTQEIQEMIEALQSKAKEAESTMGEGTTQLSVVEEKIEGACISLAEIAGYVQTIEGMNTTIASAAEQQSVAVGAIREVVHTSQSRTQIASEVLDNLSEAESSLQALQQQLASW